MAYKVNRSGELLYRPGQDHMPTRVKQYHQAYKQRDDKRKENLVIEQILTEIAICSTSRKRGQLTSDR